MKIYAIITAGGTSSRFGATNKLLQEVKSKAVIAHTVEAFLGSPQIDKIIISANLQIIPILEDIFKSSPKISIIEGGSVRQQSVYNALKFCDEADYVLIHDGARPMISQKKINEAIELVQVKKALTVAVKTTDTIKKVDENLKIIETIDRSALFNTQTPQAFEYSKILAAHEKLKGQSFTDDCSMLEAIGFDVYVLDGDYTNIKVTTKSDMKLLESFLN